MTLDGFNLIKFELNVLFIIPVKTLSAEIIQEFLSQKEY
ncbi:conserved hypothetical protein (plasmid) [Borreliella burgdorferi 94a]|nr:conserved hypothetical protein [Borreliella burgdorferi 94a]